MMERLLEGEALEGAKREEINQAGVERHGITMDVDPNGKNYGPGTPPWCWT